MSMNINKKAFKDAENENIYTLELYKNSTTGDIEYRTPKGNIIKVTDKDGLAGLELQAQTTEDSLAVLNAQVLAIPGANATTTVVNISAAQILEMGSTPITLLAAPGAGKYYDYDIFLESSISAINLNSTNVLVGDSVEYGGTVINTFAFTNSNGEFFRINQSTSIYTNTEGLATVAPILSQRVNAPIVMTTYDGSNPASCTGTMRAIITYTERTFGA